MIKRPHLAGELGTAANAPVLLGRSVKQGIGPIREKNVLEPKALPLAGLADVVSIRV